MRILSLYLGEEPFNHLWYALNDYSYDYNTCISLSYYKSNSTGEIADCRPVMLSFAILQKGKLIEL